MLYFSTRDPSRANTNFQRVLLGGLAQDGGLFLPQSVPRLDGRLAAWRGLGLAELMAELCSLFGDASLTLEACRQLTAQSYASFRHPQLTPLRRVGETWVCELFHGPTFAFKDVAMQLLGRLFARALAQSGETMTVLGATSGDTGAAAVHALGGLRGIRVFILYPRGRIGPLVERQLACAPFQNTHALAVEGDFDACQALVKALFMDAEFARRQRLAAVNSINFVRVMAQSAYFFYAYLQVLEHTPGMRLGDPLRFCVPSGNFGHAWAALLARQLGLPLGRLIAACNANDFLLRAVAQGHCQSRPATATHSPSMDIQAPSNFERYLYQLSGGQAPQVQRWVQALQEGPGFTLPPAALAQLRSELEAFSASNQETLEAIRTVHARHGVLLDPHTAVGWCALEKAPPSSAPSVLMATAHPAKFPEALTQALGHEPPPPPPELAQLAAQEPQSTVLPNCVQAVREAIQQAPPAA